MILVVAKDWIVYKNFGTLNLLAFLFHTVLDLVDEKFRLIRQELRTRRRFFQDMETLLRYFVFPSWDAVLLFIFKGLELDTTWSALIPAFLLSDVD